MLNRNDKNNHYAQIPPKGTTKQTLTNAHPGVRRSNFPFKSKKGREGESLALLQIWNSILGYLLGLIDPGEVHSLIKDNQIDLEYKN